jgi:4,5-DOPA dioxygenase extradiol|tara:strand:+ start:15692 stop:16465 length:774 start_codon:yes stop_codon:yes gene_type:complete
MFPSIFISHGSPQLCITQYQSAKFLKKLPSSFKKPKYIIIISAHWVTKNIKILSNPTPDIIYDFYGFPKDLYEKKYPIKNHLIKVDEIIEKFNEKNISISRDDDHEGYDHGVWAPLSLMYPKADIPVIQISLPIYYSARELIEIGEILQSFRNEALIIGSGTLTHNLRDSNWDINADTKDYAQEFRDWIVSKLEYADIESLCEFLLLAPRLTNNHPTLEHLLPLFITLGASINKKGKALNNVFMYGNQAMDCIIFEK